MKVPVRDGAKCDLCGVCVGVCPKDAITIELDGWNLDPDLCTGCGNCVAACPYRALRFEDEGE